MKYTLFTLISFFLVIGLSAQESQLSEKNLFAAIEKGETETIAQFIKAEIELCFPFAEGYETRASASRKLKAFFNENVPQSFSTRHKGHSGSRGDYTIGTLTTADGSYRVFIYTEKSGDAILLKELRFEKPM